MGSSQAQLFPGWAGGAYAQTDLLSWLALRVELTYESAGAERLALTSAGAPFDQYGVSFSSFTVPVLLRAGITWGPGQLFASTGPFLGIVAGTITIVDRYASSATTAVITPDLAHLFYFGLEGSVGYAFPFGPGRVGIELRSDWSLTPVAVGPGPADGVNPLSVNVVLSYGFRLGTATQ